MNGYKNGIRRQGVACVFAIVGPILAATGTAFAGTFRNEIAAIASMSQKVTEGVQIDVGQYSPIYTANAHCVSLITIN